MCNTTTATTANTDTYSNNIQVKFVALHGEDDK